MSESYFRSLDACYIYTNQTAFVRSNLCATCFFQVRHKVVDNLSKLMYKFFHIGIISSVTYSACTLKFFYSNLRTRSPGGGGGGTPIHYLYGYVPPKGVVILKLLV